MYARSYGKDDGKVGIYRSGDYNIPANYAGNAFDKDGKEQVKADIPAKNDEISDSSAENRRTEDKVCSAAAAEAVGNRSDFALGGIGSEELLLIGIILLLMRNEGGKHNDGYTTALILMLLLFTGHDRT